MSTQNLLCDDAGRHFAGPPHHRKRAHAALEWRREEVAAPRPARSALAGYDAADSVVAADDHHRVVLDTRLPDRVEDLADANVHFGDQVCVITAALDGFAGKCRIGNSRWMHLRITDVG